MQTQNVLQKVYDVVSMAMQPDGILIVAAFQSDDKEA